MTSDETLEWVGYHSIQQPAWEKWVQKMDGENWNIIKGAWDKALSKTELADAKAASDGITAGTIKRPYHVEDHVAAIVAAAAELRAERRHGESTAWTSGRDYSAEKADREVYMRERASGNGLLNRLACQLGLPKEERPYTAEEIRRQLRAAKVLPEQRG